ncbi:MAG TPA: N-acetylmuramoyl-L-alanine amidase-like domain-containing protein [Vulgatibacter sp.]|nr:N-acetylmuramoyl-L-alanine amidase-like domain-containing protein [Vulgatibacter sp.]
MRRLLAPLLVALALPSPALSSSPTQAVQARVEAAIAETATGWERVKRTSRAFLGTPYRNSPLGEGAGIDPDPRLRWDAVDCLTLIETAIAVGEARSPAEVEPILDDIRYADGKPPAFDNRLHLMEAQWIPDLQRKGYLREATARFGGDAVVHASISYGASEWKVRTRLRSLPWQPSLEGTHTIPYLPLADAAKVADTLPEGLLVNVVRAPVPGAVSLVTHSGILVIEDGRRFVRHAALRQAQVIDEPLDRFIARHAQMRLRRVLGLNLLEIRPNPARAEKAVSSRRIGEHQTLADLP